MKKFFFALLLGATPALAVSLRDATIERLPQLNKPGWRLANAGIEMEITCPGNHLLLTRLQNIATGTDWTPAPDLSSIAPLIHFRSAGREYRQTVPGRNQDFQLTADNVSSDGNSVLLRLVFTRKTKPKLAVSLFYRVYPKSFIESWSEIQNLDAATEPSIDLLQVGRFRLPIGAASHWKVADLRDNKYGERERIHWIPVLPGRSVDIPLIGTEGKPDLNPGRHGYIHTFFVQRNSSESLIGGVLYGHRAPIGFGFPGPLRFTSLAGGKNATAELLDSSSTPGAKRETLQIGSGQSAKGLSFVFAFSGPDLSAASTAYHQLARKYLMPAAPAGSSDDLPWVEFNPYYAYDLGWDVAQLKRDADIAADLGVEMFIIDAGWWEGALKKTERVANFSDYLIGAGTYTTDNTTRFPRGGMTFLDFSNYVHAKGMKFGLWFCPFNVDSHRNTGWDPSWLAGDGEHLCPSDKPAFDWVKSHTDQVVENYHVDFLKFDCFSPQRCVNLHRDAGRKVGSKEYVITAHQGYDDFVTSMRRDHPSAEIEDDLMLGHTMPSADDFDLSHEQGRTVLEKDRFTEPPQYTGLYLMQEPVKQNGMDDQQYRAYVNYMVRSCIMGHITISSDLSKWTPSFRAVVKRHIQLYREHRRVLTGWTHELALEDDWEAVQFQDPEATDTMVFVFRKKSSASERRFLLHDLLPEKIYQVSFEDRKDSFSRTGQELMTQGVSIALPTGPSSEMIYVR